MKMKIISIDFYYVKDSKGYRKKLIIQEFLFLKELCVFIQDEFKFVYKNEVVVLWLRILRKRR